MSESTTGSESRRPLLFILKNGPIYSVSDHIAYQVTALSRDFDCEVWSRGDIEVDERPTPGSRIRIVKSDFRSNIAGARYLRDMVKAIRAAALRNPGRVAVLAHDPLKSGLMGWVLARAVRAPLIVEVNGVYGNPDNYGGRGRFSTSLRVALFRRVAGFVLSRAAGVRLLFPGQLDGFAALPGRAAVRTFFDITSIDRFCNEGEQKVVLFVGYPFHTKGVDVLIRAFDSISADYPDWRLVLLGHELGEEAKKWSGNPRITVLRAVSNSELAPVMNKAGIFVLPSRSEAMGRVLLEAAAAAKPRIGSRVGGIPTVIEHGKDGLLFEKEDVEGLATQLRTLMESELLRRQLGSAARRRIESEFSTEAYLRHMDDLVSGAFAASSGR